jgi:DNA primase
MELNNFIDECNEILLLKKCSQETLNAKEYLKLRGVSKGTVVNQKIGYCPSNKKIPNSVKFFGNELREKDDQKNYDFFIRKRLIVPIYNMYGDLIAFSTREPSFEAKYGWWNCPAPFHKKNHLYMLDKTKKHILKQNKVYVVEGYMDALTMFQNGTKNVVCLMGTALTKRHIALMVRFCNNICFCFDIDANNSGQKAKNKSILAINKFDFHDTLSTIDSLPEGEDPSSFILKNGMEKFLQEERIVSKEEISSIIKNQ